MAKVEKKYAFKYGGKRGKKINLVESPDMVVVRTVDNQKLENTKISRKSRQLINQTDTVADFPEAGVSIMKMPGDTINEAREFRDITRASLKEEEEIRFAGRVLQDEKTGEAMLYTENFFVKFKDKTTEERCKEMLAKYELVIKDKLFFATNSYFVCAKEGTGLEVFDLAEMLLKETEVEFCHPELVQERRFKDLIHPLQWHLAETVIGGTKIENNVNIEAAWAKNKGEGITIAIIDDGFEINHPEFKDRIVEPWDATSRSTDVLPKMDDENHGTACAGVALASGLRGGASGTAPEAKLMPIRLRSGLGSMAEAQAFGWAAQKGADIISCSWGPPDGSWWDPMDPVHNRSSMLPDSTRLAIDYAMKEGRGGKGCVVLFAAGNGNENIENDGYASYDPIITVAASNDSGSRSVYSDYGENVWVSFPSGDFAWPPFGHPKPVSQGIRTTDRFKKAGYDESDYTNTFSGTSSACPGMAGVVALMLSANPELSPKDIKAMLQKSCVKIDTTHGDYNALGHSPFYGYGRINAELAVENAIKSIKKEEKPKRPTKTKPAKETKVDANKLDAQAETPTDVPIEKLGKLSLEGSIRFSDGTDLAVKTGRWIELKDKKIAGLQLQIKGIKNEDFIASVRMSDKILTSQDGNYIGAADGRRSVFGIALALFGTAAKSYDIVYGVRYVGVRGVQSAQNGDFVGIGKKKTQPPRAISSFIVLLKKKKT